MNLLSVCFIYYRLYKGYCIRLFDLNLRCIVSNCYWCSLGVKYLDNLLFIF